MPKNAITHLPEAFCCKLKEYTLSRDTDDEMILKFNITLKNLYRKH